MCLEVKFQYKLIAEFWIKYYKTNDKQNIFFLSRSYYNQLNETMICPDDVWSYISDSSNLSKYQL